MFTVLFYSETFLCVTASNVVQFSKHIMELLITGITKISDGGLSFLYYVELKFLISLAVIDK